MSQHSPFASYPNWIQSSLTPTIPILRLCILSVWNDCSDRLDIKKLKAISSPVPFCTKPILVSILNKSNSNRIISLMRLIQPEQMDIKKDFQTVRDYEEEDAEEIEKQKKLQSLNYNRKELKQIQQECREQIIKDHNRFVQQLQPYQPFIKQYSEFFDHNELNTMLSSHATELVNSTSSLFSKGNLESSLNGSTDKKTLTINNTQTFPKLEIIEREQLVNIIIKKGSLSSTTEVVIHNNPKLETIQIEEDCGNGKVEKENCVRSFKISFNSSLQKVEIGDNCFQDWDCFEINSKIDWSLLSVDVNNLETLTFGTCTNQYENKGPIFGNVQSLSLKNLTSLKQLQFGDNSFPHCEELVIDGSRYESIQVHEYMSKLHSITFGGKSFEGNIVFSLRRILY